MNNDVIYISIILIIFIILVSLNSKLININIKQIKNNVINEKIKEEFRCENSKFRKHQKINYPKLKKEEIYKEDEDINYHIKVPLKPKPTNIHDNLGWRNFFYKSYNNKNIIYPDNFSGTVFRNYLDNFNFFQN